LGEYEIKVAAVPVGIGFQELALGSYFKRFYVYWKMKTSLSQ
jgi:hypothetical protein